MTLSTNVYVLDPVPHREVFRFCQGLLTPYDPAHRGPDQQTWTDKQDSSYRDGAWAVHPDSPWCIGNEVGQGLPAWLLIGYRPDGPLRTPEQAAECDEDCEPDCDHDHGTQACWLNVDFDTSYSYRVNGMGCGDLHAAIVAELGQWLDGRGVRWSWCNEFTGEVHAGDDRYIKLIELCRGGFEAQAWMETTVLPAILAGINRGEL